MVDGVIQAPGGPDEDTSGGFAYGGWIHPYADPVQSDFIRQQMSLPFDLLLGRTTFEIWAPLERTTTTLFTSCALGTIVHILAKHG